MPVAVSGLSLNHLNVLYPRTGARHLSLMTITLIICQTMPNNIYYIHLHHFKPSEKKNKAFILKNIKNKKYTTYPCTFYR